MKVYLVGGTVREHLMSSGSAFAKQPIEMLPKYETDRDWVVVGATVTEMLELGYRSVGKDFPVFLHPESKEEYAMARSIRSGRGWSVVDTTKTVSLEEDLIKRDLTINAIAMDCNGRIYDPTNGMQDIYNRVLRMTSRQSFVDDPVRVLRVARFAAKYPEFTISHDTMLTMRELVRDGYLHGQTPERIWKELAKGLMQQKPSRMLQVLRECDALRVILPEVNRLYGVPQPEQHHPEIDTGIHIEQVLDVMADTCGVLDVRFAALTHDLGKGLTPKDNWPAHHGHEELGIEPVKAVCERLRVPNTTANLALLAAEYHGKIHGSMTMKNTSIVRLLRHCDAFRRPDRFKQLLNVAWGDAKGRRSAEVDYKYKPYPQWDLLYGALEIAQRVDQREIAERFKDRPDHIQVNIHAARARAIRNFVKEFKKNAKQQEAVQ